MSESKFFAVISRMKYINRWALMRNTINENISEHSLEVAFIAHVLHLSEISDLADTFLLRDVRCLLCIMMSPR